LLVAPALAKWISGEAFTAACAEGCAAGWATDEETLPALAISTGAEAGVVEATSEEASFVLSVCILDGTARDACTNKEFREAGLAVATVRSAEAAGTLLCGAENAGAMARVGALTVETP
jgi:hypothetical protein